MSEFLYLYNVRLSLHTPDQVVYQAEAFPSLCSEASISTPPWMGCSLFDWLVVTHFSRANNSQSEALQGALELRR